MSDVFISHVEEDAGIALEIALGLEEAGYTTWCYEVDNIPGPSYLLQTGQAVEQAKALVLVISPHSLGSRQVTKEVIRAHETGGEFIPVLRDITHIEFQNRQPEWREALGAASSIRVPMEGVADIMPRIISGLKASGVLPGLESETAHIAQIRKTLSELKVHRVLEQTKEPPITATRPKPEDISAEIPREKAKLAVSVERPVLVVKVITKPGWFWTAIALLSIGLGLLAFLTSEFAIGKISDPWWAWFTAMLLFVLPFIIPGVYCLRRGMAQAPLSKLDEVRIPNWWWLLPIFLAFIGGTISWMRQKDIDWRKAVNMLTLGIIATLIWAIPFLVFLTPVAPSTPLPTPEAPPVESYSNLIYEDDFSNPNSSWLRESREDKEFYYKDGEYCFLIKRYDWAVCVWNRNAGLFTDFALEIDARLISGPEGSCYGVIFRVQRAETENYYRFLVSGEGYYLIGTKTNDVWTVLQDWEKSTFIKEGNNTNHLKVVCQGSQIEVYVNGHHLTTVTDNSFAEGSVGMIVDTPETDTRVAFDNIKVYSLD